MQLGFWKFNKSGIPCNPIHWFQFADDAAVLVAKKKKIKSYLIASQYGANGPV